MPAGAAGVLLPVPYSACRCHVLGLGGSGARGLGPVADPGLPLQYGMLLYQNYRIPPQRKALLPSFSTPVVSTLAAEKLQKAHPSWDTSCPSSSSGPPRAPHSP